MININMIQIIHTYILSGSIIVFIEILSKKYNIIIIFILPKHIQIVEGCQTSILSMTNFVPNL